MGGKWWALHGFVAGVPPVRVTTDIDIVADVVVRSAALQHVVAVLESLEFVAEPSVSGRSLHRFVSARNTVDLVVPDHPPAGTSVKIHGYPAVQIAGGRRALDRAALVPVNLGSRHADIVMPDLRGALVMKARAAVTDSRNPDRHISDLAFLSTLISDPIAMAAALDVRERRSLRRVKLPTTPVRNRGSSCPTTSVPTLCKRGGRYVADG